MYHVIQNPPKWLLDGLLSDQPLRPVCPECKAETGLSHLGDCDVARCSVSGQQYASCGCADNCVIDTWSGLWPGTQEAYDNGFACYDDITHTVVFDLNRASMAVVDKAAEAEKTAFYH